MFFQVVITVSGYTRFKKNNLGLLFNFQGDKNTENAFVKENFQHLGGNNNQPNSKAKSNESDIVVTSQ